MSLRRGSAALQTVDVFPGDARARFEGALTDLEAALSARFSPAVPHPVRRRIRTLKRKDCRGHTRAAREHRWTDRVCSAWLIRSSIDSRARFPWLQRPKDGPKRAVGFDFDGAEFIHVDAKVALEALLASFRLEGDAGLRRLGALGHDLVVGGASAPGAPGLAAIASGARSLRTDDDALLAELSPTLDSLYRAYSVANSPPPQRTAAPRRPSRFIRLTAGPGAPDPDPRASVPAT